MITIKPIEEENITKKIFDNTNWTLIFSTLTLSFLGFIMIYSSTFSLGNPFTFLSKQIFAFILGLGLIILLTTVNYQMLKSYYVYIYIISIIMLISVLIFGTTFKGTKGWIDFKIFNLQVSEIVRILFIISLAGYLDEDWQNNNKFFKFAVSMGMSFLVIVLILAQPDVSGTVLFFPIIWGMFFLSGINRTFLYIIFIFIFFVTVLFLTKIYLSLINISLVPKWVSWIYLSLIRPGKEVVVVCLIIFFIIFFFWWILKNLRFNVTVKHLILAIALVGISFSLVIATHKFIKPYQYKRFVAFINPYIDPSDAGYQVIQTRIAIGSGQLLGKGLFKGTQAQLGFVPAKHTDFIFSLIAEELGFLGSTLVIGLYLILILEMTKIMVSSRDSYGSLIACGIVCMFVFYFVVNIGMCLGVLPVVGIPLPFVSYGGSNLVASYMAVGLLNSVHIRKFLY